MAWLQNLAGKAEDLLNKVDQNAATVLMKGTSKSNEKLNLIASQSSSELYRETDVISSQNSSASLSLLGKTSLNSSLRDVSNLEDGAQADTVDTGITFTVASEKKKKKDSPIEDLEKPQHCDKSTSSTTSSIHNSFILAEETQKLNQKIAKLEYENQDLNKQLLNLQHLYSELRNDNSNLQSQIERLSEQLTFAQEEKDQYIARAQRILQEKEKLISLKQDNATPEENENIFANYNEQLKEELKFQQDKNNDLLDKNQRLSNDIQSLQIQHQIIQNGLQQSNLSLEESLLKEKKYRSSAEEDCEAKAKEIHVKNQFISQLQESLTLKDSDIYQLQIALKQKSNINVNDDLEYRIQSLTETLMLKQNNLEAVTTERNALKLQVEKLEMLQRDYQMKLAQLQKAQVKIVNVPDTDDKSQIPQFMRVSLLDAGVTRRVKHAYSVVDAISIRTGIFLRRYPVARVCIFCYMVLLHIWVLIILFIYAPSSR